MNSNDARSRSQASSQTSYKVKTDRHGKQESMAYARAAATGIGNHELVTDTQITTVVFQVAPDGTVTVLSSPSSYSYASVRSSS